MVSINFSFFIHLIIIFFAGSFLQSFFSLLYDKLILFKQKESISLNKYNDTKQDISKKIEITSNSIAEIDRKIKNEIDNFNNTSYFQLNRNEKRTDKKENFTLLKENEIFEIYTFCNEGLEFLTE